MTVATLPSAPWGSYAPRMSTNDDAELISAFAAGDSSAFETLYRRHKDSVYRYLLRLGSSPTLAEDVAQEVWMKVINYRDRYRADAKFSTFLYRVTHNAYIDQVRRERIKVVDDGAEHIERMTIGNQVDTDAEADEVTRVYRAALAALPDEQRNAYLLRQEAGLGLDDIADVTGSNREAVKSRLRYATKRLKEQLAHVFVEEPQHG